MPRIDIGAVLAEKAPRLARWVPGFVLRWLRRTIHEPEINYILEHYWNLPPQEFIRACFREWQVTNSIEGLDKLTPAATTSEGINVKELRAKCYEAMNDDLNTPIVIAQLFEGARIINNVIAGNATISAEDLKELKETFHLFCFDIMGLKEEKGSSDSRENAYGKVVDMLLEQRMKAKANKDWATSDEIRNTLTALGFEVKDTKDGFEWRLNK